VALANCYRLSLLWEGQWIPALSHDRQAGVTEVLKARWTFRDALRTV
jgi:hypothetical protein